MIAKLTHEGEWVTNKLYGGGDQLGHEEERDIKEGEERHDDILVHCYLSSTPAKLSIKALNRQM